MYSDVQLIEIAKAQMFLHDTVKQIETSYTATFKPDQEHKTRWMYSLDMRG